MAKVNSFCYSLQNKTLCFEEITKSRLWWYIAWCLFSFITIHFSATRLLAVSCLSQYVFFELFMLLHLQISLKGSKWNTSFPIILSIPNCLQIHVCTVWEKWLEIYIYGSRMLNLMNGETDISYCMSLMKHLS